MTYRELIIAAYIKIGTSREDAIAATKFADIIAPLQALQSDLPFTPPPGKTIEECIEDTAEKIKQLRATPRPVLKQALEMLLDKSRRDCAKN